MDKARKITDKKLQQMEKKINSIYKEANGEISDKWNSFMKSHEPKLQKAYDDMQEAIKSGDQDAIKEAKNVYERTAKNITINDKRFQGMVDETAAKISHTNEVALSYVNDQVPGIYTINYNAFGDEKIKGYSFSLVNEQAVKTLAVTDKMLLPTKKLDIPKDLRWNEKMINSQITQGILQGESIPTIARRLRNVTDMNRASSIRNARTMTTAAENKGRQDSYVKATEDGVILMRVWVATGDERTRAWHMSLNGVEVGVNEPWVNEYGEIMEPGDPGAHPCNVYNCRCAMKADVKGFKWSGKSATKQGSVDQYKQFADVADIKTERVGRYVDFDGNLVREGHLVEYATEYKGSGLEVTEFFKANSNSTELIKNMSTDEQKAFKDMWSKGKFMQGQQYNGFSNMKPRFREATKVFDKYLDQSTLDAGVEVVRLSDAQLLFGAGSRTGSLEDFIAMKGKQVTCNANMSFSAASEGLRITYAGEAPTVEYTLKIPKGTKGCGMYIGDDQINIWGDKQREFMTNRNIWMSVGDTTYDTEKNIFKVELNYGGLMDHDYK